MKAVWKWFDGNKTIIGTFLLLLFSQEFAQNWFDPGIMTVLKWTIATLTGASLIHHGTKGKFSTKKN